MKSPAKAEHRPTGLAVGQDGSLYVSDDVRGRIYRIVYQGGSESGAANVTPCPSASAPAGNPGEVAAHRRRARIQTPVRLQRPVFRFRKARHEKWLLLGERIYRGQVGGATCTGCHGDSGQGTPLGPNLKGNKWLWSDGSYAGIKKSIAEGVPQPKQYRSPMPPMGGAQLTPEQVSALAAYVWSLGHPRSPNRK